ncbi:hypothetical protein SAMN02745194_04690 [Roseomonas rosea]|uniref:Uncharacterized protein n=2 Tax=Muricoccus roseus TaxID=198092 RepID=A0A1M6RHV0_9PROT|nr:hypothetical protein SAMN02745194_04690 [Roseomonas rosea]
MPVLDGPMTGEAFLAYVGLPLNVKVKDHDVDLEQLTPDLVQIHGMGAGTAAEMLVLQRRFESQPRPLEGGQIAILALLCGRRCLVVSKRSIVNSSALA